MRAEGASLEELRTALDSGATTSVELVERACMMARRHPATFITLDEKTALQQAAAHDVGCNQGASGIEGIPVAVKDVIDTAGLRTTMASKHFRDHVPEHDAAVVAAFRKAGAVVVGKTNAQEFSYGIRGDQGAFGRVPNPHDPDRLAGGSSSGSAAAVAQGIVPLAIGTDTAGSVRVPAALCGVVGFKPTYGRIVDSGIFPLSPSFDTVGFFAGTAREMTTTMAAAGLLPELSCRDSSGSRELHETPRMMALNGLRATVQDDAAGIPHDLLVDALGLKPMALPDVDGRAVDFADLYDAVRIREAYSVHRNLLQAAPKLYQPSILARLQAGAKVSDESVVKAKASIAVVQAIALEHFAEIDILVSPTVPVLAPFAADERPEVGASLMEYTALWNVLGWPAITIPCTVPGQRLPQSVQLIGKPGEDSKVLAAASAAEQIICQPR